MDSPGFEQGQGLRHRRAGRTVMDCAEAGRLGSRLRNRGRHQLLRGLQLASQALHVVRIVGAGLAVFGVGIARRAAAEEGALGRVGARYRAPGNAIAIDIEIAAEILARIQHLGGHHLAAIVAATVVPVEGLAQAIVHADIQIEQDKHRRLQAVSQVEGLGTEREALVGVFGKQHHVLGIAVRSVGAGNQVRLLGARRHAGRRAAALHVEDHRRHFGKVGQAEKLLHQGNARAGCRGEGARPIPRGADHHADRGQFVLGLDDGITRHAIIGICPVLAAVAAEGLDHRGRRRDRIPGSHRGPAIHGAQAAGIVAVDEDLVADAVRALHTQADRTRQVGDGVIKAQLQCIDIGPNQLVLAAILVGNQLFHHAKVDAQQRGQGTDVHDVLEQLALAGIRVFAVAHLGQRNAEHGDVLAEARARQALGRVVEQVAAGLDLGDVAIPGLRIHRHHQVATATATQPTGGGNAHLVPGRHPLDVGRKDVARRHRHAHAHDGPGKQFVGRCRARAIDIGELDDEVVAAFDGIHLAHVLRASVPASAHCMKNFCMSQAPVGQRSAHMPQCRQMFSSLTMTRPVFRPSET